MSRKITRKMTPRTEDNGDHYEFFTDLDQMQMVFLCIDADTGSRQIADITNVTQETSMRRLLDYACFWEKVA